MENKSFTENLVKSMKIFNNFQHDAKNRYLSILKEGYFYSIFNTILEISYIIYKNQNNKIVKGPKYVLTSIIIDPSTILYFTEDIIEESEEKKCYNLKKLNYDTGKITKLSSFLNDSITNFYFSENGNFLLFCDIFQNLKLYSIRDLKIVKNINLKDETNFEIEDLHISPDGETFLCKRSDKLIIIKNDDIKYLEKKYYLEYIHKFERMEVYFGEDDVIKLGFSHGNILYLKNGEIIKKTNRNFHNYFQQEIFFSKDGKILVLKDTIGFRFIHEDSDEYSNNFCYRKSLYDGELSPDCKFFFGREIKNKIITYDLSFIGYKKCQKLQFLYGLNDKNSNLNSFSKNVLFDINIVKLIFDFLPFSIEVNDEETIFDVID